MAALAPDARTAVVTLTHDPKLDDPAIRVALALAGLLPRLPRLDPHPCQAAWTGCAPRASTEDADRPHPCAGRPGHRREKPGRDRRVDPGPDHPGPEAGLMEFGPVPLAQAEGAILAHSLMLGGSGCARGWCWDRRRSGAAARPQGVAEVTVARLEPGRRGRGCGGRPAGAGAGARSRGGRAGADRRLHRAGST